VTATRIASKAPPEAVSTSLLADRLAAEAAAPSVLAFRVPRLPGEAVDSWVEYVARKTLSPVRATAISLGFQPTPSPYYFVRDVSAGQLERIAVGIGMDPSELEGGTLRRWASLGLCPERLQRGHSPGSWPRSSGARFCPECIQETDGRFQLAWYLQWSLCCLKHSRMLAAACPVCGRVPRTQRTVTWRDHPGAPEGCSDGCTAEALASAQTLWLHEAHPLLDFQRDINTLLSDPTTRCFVGGLEAHPRVWLHDLAALTRAAVLSMGDESPTAIIQRAAAPDARADLTDLVGKHAIPRRLKAAAQLSAASASPALLGVSAVIASDCLGVESIEDLSRALDWLPRNRRAAVQVRARHEEHTSAFVYAARPVTERFRWPNNLRGVVAEVAALYPNVNLVLDPSRVPARLPSTLIGRYPRILSGEAAPVGALSAVLAGPDPWDLRHIPGLLGLQAIATDCAIAWQQIMESDEAVLLWRDLLMLRVSWISGPAPIDYGRRRYTFPKPIPLSARRARRLAVDLGVSNTAGLRRMCIYFIWETLTGSDALCREEALQLPGGFRARYRKQRALWEATVPSPLAAEAERMLLRHRINEPIMVSPYRTSDGCWIVTEPLPRQLSGWDSRELRRSSRHFLSGALVHATASQIVDFVRWDGTPYAHAVATHLRVITPRYRLGRPKRGQPIAPSVTRSLDWLHRETGRDLDSTFRLGTERISFGLALVRELTSDAAGPPRG